MKTPIHDDPHPSSDLNLGPLKHKSRAPLLGQPAWWKFDTRLSC
jgi:hypothetical protein